MLNILSLSQLEHKANTEDNFLALAILSKLDEEVEEAVENATTVDDSDYSYSVFDAMQAVESLMFDATWYKVGETKQTKDKIVYMIKGLHEDPSPYNNQVKLWKYKGCEGWTIEGNGGQYGEQTELERFAAAGFKEAQQKATKETINWIKRGFELNTDI